MNEEMLKSLASLIDESLHEIEELKKSDRFSASEVKMGDSEGLAGKDKNGSLGKEEAEKADDEEDKKEDDDKKDDDDKKEDEAEKAEGKNSEADPNAGHHQVAKEETGMPEGTAKAEDCEKGEGKNSEADPNAGHHQVAKSEDEAKEFGEELKKSREETETLMKSYIDEKVGGLESKLASIAEAVQALADSPVPSRGATYKDVQPLAKSEPEETPLTKSDVVDKLFELKKSGESVDSVDIASAELGNPSELVKIVNKYNIK
jgi:hypothetical protein